MRARACLAGTTSRGACTHAGAIAQDGTVAFLCSDTREVPGHSNLISISQHTQLYFPTYRTFGDLFSDPTVLLSRTFLGNEPGGLSRAGKFPNLSTLLALGRR